MKIYELRITLENNGRTVLSPIKELFTTELSIPSEVKYNDGQCVVRVLYFTSRYQAQSAQWRYLKPLFNGNVIFARKKK